MRKMKRQKMYSCRREGETHERDHEDSDQHSSSESCNNIAVSTQKNKNYECEAVSSRAKSGFVNIPEENKRETNMQQKFRELSSVVPGLNMKEEDLMMDDAIEYLKRLQERAKILEEQDKNICIEKAWVFGDKYIGESSFSSSIYQFKKGLPEIKAKAQGKNVLIRVHCENKKKYVAKVIGEIEKFHLNIENISSLPFGDYFLDITVTAQISSDEFLMTMKDLKRELREALQLFM